MAKTLVITGLQANVLLFALDEYFGVDCDGRLRGTEPGYTKQELQELRDMLFDIHEHPEEDEDN